MSRLAKLLSHQNPNETNYQRLIAAAKANNSGNNAPYIQGFASIMQSQERLHQLLRNKLTGKVLVDLGCGEETSRKKTIELATSWGVKHLIATDFMQVRDEIELDIGEIHVSVLRRDMLEVVMRLQNDSVCFLLSGIDNDISRIEPYNKALANEMYRATIPGGITLTHQTNTYGDEIRAYLYQTGYVVIPKDFLDCPTEIMLRFLEIFEKK